MFYQIMIWPRISVSMSLLYKKLFLKNYFLSGSTIYTVSPGVVHAGRAPV